MSLVLGGMNTFEDGSPFPSGNEFFEWCVLVYECAQNASMALNEANEVFRAKSTKLGSLNRETTLIEHITSSLLQVTNASKEHSLSLELTSEFVTDIEEFIKAKHSTRMSTLAQIESNDAKALESKEDNALHKLSASIDSLLLAPQLPVAAPSLFRHHENGITALCTIADDIKVEFLLPDCEVSFYSFNAISPGFEWPSIVDGQWLPNDLSHWRLDHFSLTPTTGEFILRSHKDSPDALSVSILRNDTNATVRLQFNQETLVLEDEDGRFKDFQIAFYRKLVDCLKHTKDVVCGHVNNVPIYDTEGCLVFFDRIVDTIAPLAEELVKRSSKPNEWVISGESKTYSLSTNKLKKRLHNLNRNLAKCFERIPLPTDPLHQSEATPDSPRSTTQVTKAPNFRSSTPRALAG